MNDEDRDYEIWNKIKSTNFTERIEAVRALNAIKGEDPFLIIEGLLKQESNLAMKLEAINQLPFLLNQNYYSNIQRILLIALNDSDNEIKRNALLTLQKLPIIILNNELEKYLLLALESDDSDIQYQTVVTAEKFYDVMNKNNLKKSLSSLLIAENETLRNEATKVFNLIDQ